MSSRPNSVFVFTFVSLMLTIICLGPNFVLAGKKVLLTSVQTLTLHSDKFTTGRRGSPIPQLRCIDSKSSCKNLPSAVQCYNMGSDGIDVQWKCDAQLPKNTQFDSLQVQCEGYDYPDDPYVLAGSCGLTYSLKPAGSSSHKSHKSHSHSAMNSKDISLSIGFFIVIVICCFAIYYFCLATSATRRRAEPSAPMPGSDYDAPPPYSDGGPGAPQYGFRPEYTDNSGSTGKAYERRTNQQQQQQQPNYSSTANDRDDQRGDSSSSGPGFWTGTAIGAIGGYLFGSSGSNRGGGSGYGTSGYTSYGERSHTTYSRQSSSSSSDGGGSPVTRTGYASTRRR